MVYFAPDADDFREPGELKGETLAAARRVLEGCTTPSMKTPLK